ncbi:U-box domain-containing protein 5-like [Phalaenopsis equestris]|uniref:U-box domain-containing protein 5-like n=1 Tax=Phalaenopsis equestris TaxID=78828 RepID=UPI0009E618EA|nr:U-box domain-containing protein 5-like [Phalaenopsis equestris]
MDSDVTKVDRVPKIPCEPKVHAAVCCELVKVLEKICCILPAIESARPGSSSGIQVLCTLNNTVEKSQLLVRYCSESSKLYLALTTESIVLRCERIRSQLIQCFCEIETMVPTRLASQIAEFLDYLREVKFIINPVEEEAGKILSNLLEQINSSEDQELGAFQKVASRLNITSSIALLVERRAIRRLLDKFHNVNDKKKKILMYFLYLIKTYEKKLRPDTSERREYVNLQNNPLKDNVEVQTELISGDSPPEEFYCPISLSLMFDPVVIASGKTYERIFIEKWFGEGHDTCPKTRKKLENFSVVPNSSMKDLISNWCRKNGVFIPNPCTQLEDTDIQALESISSSSVSSLKNISTVLLDGTKGDYFLSESEKNMSSLTFGSRCSTDSSHVKDIEGSNNNYVKLFSWSEDYQNYQSFSKFSQDMYLRFLFRFSELPTLLQVKAVEEIKDLLEGEEMDQCGLLSSGFAEALMVFLKKVCSLSDFLAQRTGAQIFLALLTNQRWELNFKIEDVIQILSSLLNCGIDREALMILQKVSIHPDFVPHIVSSSIPLKVIKFINSENSELIEIAMKILSELSSNGEMRSLFLCSGYIEKIGQFLCVKSLGKFSLNILENLVCDEEALMLIADCNSCIASIAEVLEFGGPEQEQAVAIFLSLCSRNLRNCLLVLKEGIIPSLVNISVTGSEKGKENSLKLLHVLRDTRNIDFDESQKPYFEPESEFVEHPVKKSKKLELKYRSFGFFSRKMKLISKSLAFF